MSAALDRAPFIVDAHVHVGYPKVFFAPENTLQQLLVRMETLHVQYAVNLCSMKTLYGSGWGEPQGPELERRRLDFEKSGKRIFYCGFYDPRHSEEDLAALKETVDWPGFVGIKIHPSFAGLPANDPAYIPVWDFASETDLPIVAHTWSVSSYNPVQKLSTPDKFETFVRQFPTVRLVLGHSGGRGGGRLEAVRMARAYENVYMDFAGDVYDYQYMEKMDGNVPHNKVLFGSDYPWLDARANLSRVYLSNIPSEFKHGILRDNALEVFKLEEK